MKSTDDDNLRIQSVLSLARSSSSVYSRSYHGRSRIRTPMSERCQSKQETRGRPVTFVFRISTLEQEEKHAEVLQVHRLIKIARSEWRR